MHFMGEADKTREELLAEVRSLQERLHDREQTTRRLRDRLSAMSGPAPRPEPTESQLLFEKVFQANPAAIALVQMDTEAVLNVNDQFCRLTGYLCSEVLARPLSDLHLWETPEAFASIKEAVRQRGAVYEQELRLQTRGAEVRTILGSFQQVPVQGAPCLLIAAIDISDRKQANQALRESEARFRTLADAAPVFIWMMDASGEATYVNERWRTFTGWDLTQERGQGWAEGLHVEDRERVLATYRQAFAQQTAFRLEYRFRHRSGGYRWLLDRGVPRHLPDGTFIGFIGSRVDITDNKEAEMRLVHAKEQAEEVARLKSTFLTNVTHEIRTPLTVILGFTSMLRQGVQDDYQRFVQVIERSGRRLLRMLDSLVDLAQLEAGTLQASCSTVNVSDITRSVAESMRPLAEEKGLAFTVADPHANVKAELDHEVLSRVLTHLLDNAIKFTEQGHITLSVDADERQVYLRIRDTGIGIDESFFPHMFKEFVQESTGLARSHQGTGLGLAVSKRLVELMGGSIHVDSGKGKGSVFTIRLPRQTREQVSA